MEGGKANRDPALHNGWTFPLSASSFNRMSRKEIRSHQYQICVRQQLTENSFQRRLNYSNWIIRICKKNNSFLPNIVIGEMKHAFPWMEIFFVLGGMCNNGILLGPHFFEGNSNEGNYPEILNDLILSQLNEDFHNHFNPF